MNRGPIVIRADGPILRVEGHYSIGVQHPPRYGFERALSHKPIAGSMHGEKILWLFWIRFELLPQMHQVRIYGTGGGRCFVSPHLLQQPVAAERLSCVADEILQ